MRIEIYGKERDEGSDFEAVEWNVVPRVGESITVGSISGTITNVCWGTLVNGKGSPLLDKPCVSIEVVE